MTNQQLTNFTDEQIRAKAHQIWLARQQTGEPGTPDADWKDAVSALSAEINDLTTGNSPLIPWFWLGLVVLLTIVAIIVAAARFGLT